MKKIFLLIALMIAFFSMDAQTVLLEEEVDYYEETPENGPNRKNFYHVYGSWGMMFGATDGGRSDIIPYFSDHGDLGFRYKRKFSNFYSMGYEVFTSSYAFRLADKNSRTLPDTIHYDKEKINLYALGAGYYNRFNFGRRGDYIGNFLDIGVYGEWNFASRYMYKHELNDGRKRKFKVSNPDYLNTLNYGAFARAGYNRYVLYARYRLSSIIDQDKKYADLPVFTVGIQIGFHK
jgi:hypothetical protein